jgi:DNA-binding MarR family transcriptional regulator
MRTGYHRTMEYVQARLEQLGFDDVRPAHMAIFQNLGPEGARIGELADRAKLTNQSVGYLVNYLEEHGYVERRRDPTNRRATLVCFTERSWDEADACAKILDQLDEELTTRMGAERLEQLRTLLAEAAAALQAGKLAVQAPRRRPEPLIGTIECCPAAPRPVPARSAWTPEQNNLHAVIRAACTDLNRAYPALGCSLLLCTSLMRKRVPAPPVLLHLWARVLPCWAGGRGSPDHGGVDDGLDPHRASDFLT